VKAKKVLLLLVISGFIFSAASSLEAQNEENDLYGKFLFGYRSVETSGTTEKYKEDFNLDDGLRLFNFNLHYIPQEKLRKLLDRLDINLYNFGGDPYETFSLSIQKFSKYKFQYDRRKSTYFYADQHQTGGGLLHDHHTFDFDRVMDSGSLKVMLGDNADVYLNLNRYTKKGESVTTLDINRIEFEFDRPIEEELKEVSAGINLHVNRYSLLYEFKLQEYENLNSLFLPGAADGGSFARYPSSLNYFYLDQPYNFETNTHTFKFTARPINSLLVSGSAVLSDQQLDLTYSESAEGINYLGRFFDYSLSGEGQFDRKIKLYDLDLSYLLFDRLAIIGAVRYHDFNQDGSLTADGEKETMELNFDTLGIEAGLQCQFSPKLALTLGYRHEEKDLEGIETVTYEEKTTRDGVFGNLKLTPAKIFSLTADYQYGTYHEPFTLISPTSFNRLKMTAKVRAQQLHLSASYLWQKSKTTIFEDTVWEEQTWESSRNQLSLRAGYHTEKIDASAGYALIDVEHREDRTVAYPPSWSGAGTFPWEILYEGKSNLLDGSLYVNLDESWRIGAYGNRYWNRGFWEISRIMLKAYVEYTFVNGLITQVGYRHVDLEEEMSGFNDYKANIVEFSFGYRWR
jgi:hypothetical protein